VHPHNTEPHFRFSHPI
ncbi:hypothetical protein CP8484711_0491B, partial [Chlamydia psittaci 84-8471/1]